MIAPWALAAWATLAASPEIDCSEVSPGPSPDPDAARAYLEVGTLELRHGQGRAAAVAFRAAIRLDPSSAAARAALARLCGTWVAADRDLESATRAIEEGRPEEAARLLEPRYRSQEPPAADTALLYGIALYERGDDLEARAALGRAEAAQETRDAAAMFLGLLELRSGNLERAVALLDRASRSPGSELAAAARDLSVLARKEARLAVNVLAEGGYDGRADPALDLVPVAPSGAFFYGAVLSALLRPFGERGPYATAGARRRNLLEPNAPNHSWLGGTAGLRSRRGPIALRVEYACDAIWMGARPFFSAHQLLAEGGAELGGARVGVLLSARAETYLTDRMARYTGPSLDGELSAGFQRGAGALALLYRGQVHASPGMADSWLDHGPGLRGLWPLFSGRLMLSTQLTFRTYGAPEPGFGDVTRRDVYLDGTVSFERALDREVTLFLSLGGRKAFSSVPGLEHTRLAASAGAAFTAGLW